MTALSQSWSALFTSFPSRALRYNPLCFLVAVGVLTEDEIVDYVDEHARRNPPPAA